MGFVVLFMVIVTLALLRPRLPTRKSGPLVEWGAFKEPAYMLLSSGSFCYTGPYILPSSMYAVKPKIDDEPS